MNKKIIQKYNTIAEPGSFSGFETFYHALSPEQKKKTTKSELKKWFQKQESYTFHYPRKTRFPRNQVVVGGIDKTWQADLAVFDNISEYNEGYKYVLVVIDVFSKFLFAKPMKKKDAKSTKVAFIEILKNSQRKPKQLQTDDGKEFVNAEFKKFLLENEINFFTVQSENKACIVERVIRTLKEKLYRYFTHYNTYKFIDVLDDIVDNYNGTFHRTIKMAPKDVNNSNENKIFEDMYLFSAQKPLKYKFKVNDKVRLSNTRSIFAKSYEKKWTIEVFVIAKQIPRSPPVYKLKDLNGKDIGGVFYEPELQPSAIPEEYKIEKVLSTKSVKGKKLYFVKWLGYPDSFNSWIDNIISI